MKFASTFETNYYDELPESILKSALNLLKHGAGDGWYAIVDIRTVKLEDEGHKGYLADTFTETPSNY